MKKKLKKVIAGLCIILILFGGTPVTTTVSYAESTVDEKVAEVGQAFADYALMFSQRYGGAVHYYAGDIGGFWASDYNFTSERAKAYQDNGYYLEHTEEAHNTGNPCCSHGSIYGMDCVGWAIFAIHNGLGIGDDNEYKFYVSSAGGSRSSEFTYNNWTYNSNLEGIQAGDFLCTGHHIMIYAGDNQIVHCINAGVVTTKLSEYSNKNGIKGYYRLSETGVNEVDFDSLGTYVSSSNVSSTTSGSGMSEFYFNGIPDGRYSVAARNIFADIFDFFANIASYLIGIIFYGIRIVIVGWTALIDQVLNNTASGLLGVDVDETDGISSIEINSTNNSKRLTIENLVYNSYAPLNANIFASNDD